MSHTPHDIERHGARMPSFGFGTYQILGETVQRMVETALEVGYRHVDTAQLYRNEREVGRAMAATGMREQVFLTTKVWPDRYEPGDLQRSVDESLERLGTDRVDLLLLHWPVFPPGGMGPTLEALMDVQDRGLTRHIGVSNFNVDQLRQAVSICGPGRLITNQVEYHVYLGQRRLAQAMNDMGLILTAYMPLAKGRVARDPVLAQIDEKHGKSAAQVALRWLVEQDGVAAIPATTKPERCRTNFEVFDFALTADDHDRIAALPKDGRMCMPEGLSPQWDD